MKEVLFNERLVELRKEKGATQKEVADAIGVARSTYQGYENGKREPSIQIIKALCKYYDVSADYLIGLEDW